MEDNEELNEIMNQNDINNEEEQLMGEETELITNPEIAAKATLEFATTLTGEKTKIGWVQNVGQLVQPKDGITYSAIDKDQEYMAKGKRKAETVTAEVLFVHKDHKTLKSMSDSGNVYYFFLKYPVSTASDGINPLVFTFKADIDYIANAVEDGELLKDTITFYKRTNVIETDGYPTSEDESRLVA